MKFSKQPNGNWCEYSTISDSFYESNMTEQMLLREIIADAALNIAMRYFELTQNNGGYCFDDIINEFKYDNDDRKTRSHWERKFRLMGWNKDQMARVKQRIDELLEEGELAGAKKQED
jgi:hypothetical protein